MGYYSFCNPSPQRSIEVFQRTGSLVRSFLSERKDLTPYVIGTVGSSEPVNTARSEGNAATILYLCGKTHEDLLIARRESIAADEKELARLSQSLDELASDAVFTVIGPKDMLSAIEGIDEILTV